MQSTLGIKGSILPWKLFSFAYTLQKYSSNEFDIMVPERMNMEEGVDYSEDIERIDGYTLENRVKSAVDAIDNFNNNNKNYEDVYLLGYSEGGMILPLVYKELQT